MIDKRSITVTGRAQRIPMMEKGLLIKEREEEDGEEVNLRCGGGGGFVGEVRRLGYIAGPMVAVNLSQYFLQIISIMMVGHLGQLSLSSTAIAISFCAVSGFSLIVSTSSCSDKKKTKKVQFFFLAILVCL